MSESSTGGWEKSWEAGATPWDLGGPTPIILHLSETGSLPKGRTLVPGCGRGYDVVAMACPDRYVVGLDISKTVVEQSSKRFSSLPNAKNFSFLNEDFFTWEPVEKFDLIFDYTYENVLVPLGFESISIADNELAAKPRMGLEKIGRWKKKKPSTFQPTL